MDNVINIVERLRKKAEAQKLYRKLAQKFIVPLACAKATGYTLYRHIDDSGHRAYWVLSAYKSPYFHSLNFLQGLFDEAIECGVLEAEYIVETEEIRTTPLGNSVFHSYKGDVALPW
jgi:hypothetical protein